MESIRIGFIQNKNYYRHFFFYGNLFTGESNAKKTDSVNTFNSGFNRKLSIIDGQRIKDSIKR
jgi:hypothetical protein